MTVKVPGEPAISEFAETDQIANAVRPMHTYGTRATDHANEIGNQVLSVKYISDKGAQYGN